MRVGELLGPIVGARRRELLAASYLQADETPVPVQMHDRRGENHQAYLWQYDDIGGPKLVHVGCWAHRIARHNAANTPRSGCGRFARRAWHWLSKRCQKVRWGKRRPTP